jgi:hypothetical protein
MNEHKTQLPQAQIGAFTILAATSVGALFGWPATFMYGGVIHHGEGLGLVLGLALGAAAGGFTGCLWLRAMRPLVDRGKAGWILLAGTGLGMAAGFLATIMLHTGLALITLSGDLVAILGCAIFFGLPAGLVTGLVCGLAAWGAAKWSRRYG